MRGPLAVAVGMFTVLPGAVAPEVDRSLAARVILRLPLVGALLGVLAGGALWLAGLAGPGLLPAVAGVAALAWLTGGLHLDGLADTADGLGSRRASADALAVMKRSDIGPMGVITLVLVLLADVAALASMPPTAAAVALVVAAMVGRVAVLQATARRPARPGGFGALFAGAATRPSVAAVTVAVLLAAGALGWPIGGWVVATVHACAVAGALVLAWLWARHLAARLGGMTGDTFGSILEVTQTVFLVAVGLAASALPR